MLKVFIVFKNTSLVLVKTILIKKVRTFIIIFIFIIYITLFLLFAYRFTPYEKCFEKSIEFIFAIIASKRINNEHLVADNLSQDKISPQIF